MSVLAQLSPQHAPSLNQEPSDMQASTKAEIAALADRDRRRQRTQPTAPRSAFVIFRTAVRASMRAQNPNLGSEAISKIISVHWRKLSAAEQRPYFDEAEEDKLRYQRELAVFAASVRSQEAAGSGSPLAAADASGGAGSGAAPENPRPRRRRAASRRIAELTVEQPADVPMETIKRLPAAAPSGHESYFSDGNSSPAETPKSHGSPQHDRRAFFGEDLDLSSSAKRRKLVGARSHAPGCNCPFHTRKESDESDGEYSSPSSSSCGRRMGVHSHGPNCKCKYHCSQRGERWVQKGAAAPEKAPEQEDASDVESLVPETDDSDMEELQEEEERKAQHVPWALDWLVSVSCRQLE